MNSRYQDDGVPTHVNAPTYLFFLDREILRLVNVYEYVQFETIYRDFVLALLSSGTFCYFSTSLVFENKFARRLFFRDARLFKNGIIRLALPVASLWDFILLKREQYRHAPELYRFYFDDTWIQVQERAPTFLLRKTDTSLFLEINLKRNFGHSNDVFDRSKFIRDAGASLVDILDSRENLAVTKILFESSSYYNRLKAGDKRFFSEQISVNYILSYLDEYGGTIPTGTSTVPYLFDGLGKSFPAHDFSVWLTVLRGLGFLDLLKENRFDDVCELVETKEYNACSRTLLMFLTKSYEANKNLVQIRNALSNAIDVVAKSKSRGQGIDARLRVLEEFALTVRSLTEHRVLHSEGHSGARIGSQMNKKAVFVVHGRNEAARKAVFQFLRSVGLHPIEWEQAVAMTGKVTPYVGEILECGLQAAQAVLVLLTGDDLAGPRPELCTPVEREKGPQFQPSPNVILETGMALAKYPDRTIIISGEEQLREITDIIGRYILRVSDTPMIRTMLVNRLKNAGCDVDMAGTDWMSEGDLSTIQ